MNVGDILEVVILLVIVTGFAVSIWKGGARNPVGTGGLDKRLTTIGTKVSEIEGRVEHIEEFGATAEDMKRLERALAKHQEDVTQSFEKLSCLVGKVEANKRGIDAINEKMPAILLRQSTMAEEVTETRAISKQTAKQVDRLYDVLIEKGMAK